MNLVGKYIWHLDSWVFLVFFFFLNQTFLLLGLELVLINWFVCLFIFQMPCSTFLTGTLQLHQRCHPHRRLQGKTLVSVLVLCCYV